MKTAHLVRTERVAQTHIFSCTRDQGTCVGSRPNGQGHVDDLSLCTHQKSLIRRMFRGTLLESQFSSASPFSPFCSAPLPAQTLLLNTAIVKNHALLRKEVSSLADWPKQRPSTTCRVIRTTRSRARAASVSQRLHSDDHVVCLDLLDFASWEVEKDASIRKQISQGQRRVTLGPQKPKGRHVTNCGRGRLRSPCLAGSLHVFALPSVNCNVLARDDGSPLRA